ncbi:MAG: hypothetical protein KI791_09535 [Cyclobacteriaceae bacterium]|nr:hypothetical protein [Cyclobacteriaceae bacterium SS2]
MHSYFDISRFWLLMKLELFKSRRGVAMALVIIFGLSFFLGMIVDLAIEPLTTSFDHYENYAFSLLIGGFILSSLAFHGLRNTLTRYQYLMEPVSAFERVLCMWLLSSLGWIFVFTLTFTFYTLFANTVGQLLFSHVKFNAFNPFSDQAFVTMKYYIVCQGVFLAGAAYFRGYVFPKLLILLIAIAFIALIITYSIMHDVMLADYDTGEECNLETMPDVKTVWTGAKFFFWWLLAPISWVLTYLGLKDQEV